MNKIALKLIGFYQRHLSILLGQNCRHIPTCSQYAKEAYMKHGFFKASFLTFKRIIKCNPWGTCGYDPVPEPKSKDLHSHHCND